MPSTNDPHPEERSQSASRRTRDAAAAWPGPLAGVRVIDLTRVLAGPFATQSLGDLGAEVLKIEPPDNGDETRHFPPFIQGESHYFLGINRNKRARRSCAASSPTATSSSRTTAPG